MRFFLSLALSFMIILASVPAVSLLYKDEIKTKTENGSAQVQTAAQSDAPAQAAVSRGRKADKVRVLLHESGKTVSVNHEDYIISVLAKEIDINAPEEALKAQAVCIETFLKRTAEGLKKQAYDISDNPAVHQSFLTEKQLKKFWGDSYDKNYRKLKKIVQSVFGVYLSYQGETALAAYHSSNAGMTESAENYWGKAYTYLRAVPSIGDTLCPRVTKTVKFSPKQLKSKLSAIKGQQFTFAESPSDWLAEKETTASGTVKSIALADVSLSGREVREALSLPSSFFDVSYQNGAFVFTVTGYGHGVGLSQEGAKYMAKLGFSYRDILLYYYKGVEIKGENKV